MKLLVLALIAICAPYRAAEAQSTSAPSTPQVLPAYDVVSVRENLSGSGGGDLVDHVNLFTAKNIPLTALLSEELSVAEDRIFGLPAWAHKRRYDITAKITDRDALSLSSLSPTDRRAMAATMLVQIFDIKYHCEQRLAPVYDLEVARGGAKLKASTDLSGGGGQQPAEITDSRASMDDLSQEISKYSDRPLVNKTGIIGFYDIHLKWARTARTREVEDGPSLFTAIGEQLGLRLRPAHDFIKCLVINALQEPQVE